MDELYIRVGTIIYKVAQQPLADGTMTTRRIQWSFVSIPCNTACIGCLPHFARKVRATNT